jgi:hypothetical protein
MKNAMRSLRILSLAAIASMATACIPVINLAHIEPPKAESTRGAVEIGAIKNLRPAGKGGDSFSNVGKVRGGYGNPFSLETKSGRELDISLREALSAAAATAGYAPTDAKGSSPLRAELDVNEFWCDGYAGYKIGATVTLRLVDKSSGKSVVEKTITTSNGFAIVVGYGSMHEAFDKVMRQLTDELATYMKSAEFQTAAAAANRAGA